MTERTRRERREAQTRYDAARKTLDGYLAGLIADLMAHSTLDAAAKLEITRVITSRTYLEIPKIAASELKEIGEGSAETHRHWYLRASLAFRTFSLTK